MGSKNSYIYQINAIANTGATERSTSYIYYIKAFSNIINGLDVDTSIYSYDQHD
jgi:hypothetical protein